MKTIKILLLILLAVLSMSSSEDNNVCNCIEVEEKASFPYNNYVLTGNESQLNIVVIQMGTHILQLVFQKNL